MITVDEWQYICFNKNTAFVSPQAVAIKQLKTMTTVKLLSHGVNLQSVSHILHEIIPMCSLPAIDRLLVLIITLQYHAPLGGWQLCLPVMDKLAASSLPLLNSLSDLSSFGEVVSGISVKAIQKLLGSLSERRGQLVPRLFIPSSPSPVNSPTPTPNQQLPLMTSTPYDNVPPPSCDSFYSNIHHMTESKRCSLSKRIKSLKIVSPLSTFEYELDLSVSQMTLNCFGRFGRRRRKKKKTNTLTY